MRVPVPWVFALAYLVGVGLQTLFPPAAPSPRTSGIVRFAGDVLILAGVVLAFWAQWIFRRGRTTTVPFETPTQLVTHGPYRLTRNPMYVGLTLVYLGVAGARVELWPAALLPLVLVYIHTVVIPVEERRLGEVFGGSYQKYHESVRRWM